MQATAPQIYAVENSGNVSGALQLAMQAVAPNPRVQTQLLTLVGNLISTTAGPTAAAAFQNGYSPLYALNVLSAVLLSNDTSVASANIGASNEADVFVVDVGAPAPTPPPGTTLLYVAELGNATLTATVASASGNAAPARTLGGSSTSISQDYGVAVDAGGNAYLSNLRSPVVTVYAAGASGNVAPIRTITGSNTGLNGPLGLAIDGSGNLVADNFFANTVTVFASGATGNATPVRTISGASTGLNSPYGLTLDSAGKLYVCNDASQFGGVDSVTVYAAGANGNTAPVQTISGNATGMSGAIYDAVDAAGNLYIANFLANTVTVYAAGANGNVAPTATIAGSNTTLSKPSGIAVDSGGNIYVANSATNSIAVFAAGTNGKLAPSRTIVGGSTGISGPAQILLAP